MIKVTRKTYNILPARRKTHMVIISMLIVLLAGLLTLFWQEHQRQVTHAVDDSIVGPPSLPAASVDALFASLGSPMEGTGEAVEAASRNTNIDDAFALAVWWVETNDGMAGVGLGYHNPGGVQASPNYPSNGYTDYPSYTAAVTDWFNIVQSRYVSRGLTSVYTICYSYVGTSGALNWANKVMNYMTNYRAMAPTPTPTPTQVVVQTPVSTAVNTHNNVLSPKNSSQQPADSTKLNSNAISTRSTQLLLTGLGLIIAILLAVPGLLIRRRQPALKHSLAGSDLSVTTTLRMEAIPAQYLRASYMQQDASIVQGRNEGAIHTNQLVFEDDVPATIPASLPFIEPILQPVTVGSGTRAVPPTPLQPVPVTPLLRGSSVTPSLPNSSQGGLLTRYNKQSKLRRIDLTPSSGTTHPLKKPDQNC